MKWLWEREPTGASLSFRTVYIAGIHGQKEVMDWFYTLPREDFRVKYNICKNPSKML